MNTYIARLGCDFCAMSTACLHNTDDGKVCARMLERFARQQREVTG